MRKKINIIKRVICISIIFLLNINSVAAIVSDNDGSAFITKAEFDALKNDFQAQIDSYNGSIDSKIDGAIAAYLAGISVAKQEDLTTLLNSLSMYSFEKNWSGLPNQEGDRADLRMAVQVCLNNNNGNWMGSSGNYSSKTCYLWELVWGSRNRDNPDYKEFGASKDIILVYREDTTYAGKILPIFVTTSVPTCSVMYAKSHTALDANIDTTLTACALSAWTENKGDSVQNFGTYSITHAFDPFGAAYKQTVAGTITYQCTDTSDNLPTTLPSSPVNRALTLLCLKQGDENKIGNEIMTKSLYDCGNNNQWVGGTKTAVTAYSASYFKITPNAKSWDTNSFSNRWSAKIYRHKVNKNFTLGDVNLNDISSVAGEFVTYGDGLPLCNVPEAGRISLTLDTDKIDLNNGGKFEIRKGKFNNTAMNSSPFATLSNPEPTITTLSTVVPYKYKIEFNVKDAGLYYIMCMPQDDTSASSVKTEQIRFTKDDK